MTKYEWESELKRNIHRLPENEIAKVIDYYSELFEDKIESGFSERAIIQEFGNPVDVADKILSEYDVEFGTPKNVYSAKAEDKKTEEALTKTAGLDFTVPKAETVKEEKAQSGKLEESAKTDKPKEKKSSGKISAGKLTLFIILCIFFGGAVVGFYIGLWGGLIGLFGGSVGLIGGGIAGGVSSIITCTSEFARGFTFLGVSLVLIGAGTVWFVLNIKLSKLILKLTRFVLVKVKKIFFEQKEAIYED